MEVRVKWKKRGRKEGVLCDPTQLNIVDAPQTSVDD